MGGGERINRQCNIYCGPRNPSYKGYFKVKTRIYSGSGGGVIESCKKDEVKCKYC